jgi:RNA polymerase primary sigma factor
MLAHEPQPLTRRSRRLTTQAKLPAPEVLRQLTPGEVKRLKALLSGTVEYIPNDVLDAANAEELLRRPYPPPVVAPEPAGPDDSGIHDLSGDEFSNARYERERQIFLSFNFARRCVFDLLQRHAGRRLSFETAQELLQRDRVVQDLRGMIVSENIALVLAMAKRTRIVGVDTSDLISDGNLALLRAVMKFDCSRGYRFSTYACRSILKSFSRVATRTSRHRGRFPAEFDPAFERGNAIQRRRVELEEACVNELRSILTNDMGDLSEVERQIIRARFALDNSREAERRGKTLEQVGELVGLTKERVRQIQNRALLKLRSALDQGVLAK